MNEIQRKTENIKATMAFEGKKLSPEIIQLGEKILKGEITGDDARKVISKKYKIKSY